MLKPQFLEKNMENCKRIMKNPYFDIDVVVGKPWRIYYTWNLKIDERCLDMVFKNATRGIVNRIWSDMNEYLEQQPVWGAATLHMSMGSAKHEVLLFADPDGAGSFTAVPNVVRDANLNPMRKAVPLLKFQMKLLRGGKFLLVMDCHVGGASLASRSDTPPYRLEIAAEAAALDLGDGYPACIKEKNKEEQFFVK
ncbi:uncharacterized protein LOC116777771 [Danaus plexippus]|uniref:Uncharacterized protein n=1 Tax=Danaus plexippus plexippus TaxID=278856 RepID=A0A212FMS0_DANPL|nr:uncharacterized protein LOC116777771 [Danaus plexippus]OWR54990.1 hypothetical protein KGM_206886 [Danaus plexippus plexippus]